MERINNCPHRNQCGLIKLLAERAKVKPNDILSCGKPDWTECGRIPENPLGWVPLGKVSAETHDEIRYVYVDQTGIEINS